MIKIYKYFFLWRIFTIQSLKNNKMRKQDNNIFKKSTYIIFLLFFFVGVFTYKDYGISVDEEFERRVGFYWLEYVLSLTSFDNLYNFALLKLNEITGFTLPTAKDHKFYGVIFSLPMALLEIIFKINDPREYFYLRHLSNFGLFFASSIFFYKLLLNRFSKYNIALIGTLFFILSPRIYGSSFFNSKDIVFLSLVSIALYYCIKSIEKASYRNLFVFSIFAAICTSSRILGIIFPISFIIFYFLSFFQENKNLNKIIFFIISYLIFLIIFWPALWENPIENFLLAFKYFSDLQGYNIKMFFNGEYIHAHYLPYNYIFTWILITTPMLYIALFLVGYFHIFKRFFIRFINIKEKSNYPDLWRDVNEKKDLFMLFILTSVIFYLIIFNVILYTGWRQIYFLNVFIIYISTCGLYKIHIDLQSKIKPNIQFGAIGLFLIFIIYKMIIYHPYQNLYFNSIFNKDVHNKFEVDYWGLSGKKFLETILILEKNKNPIKIGVASFLPLERSLKLLSKEKKEKIIIVGQDYEKADYIYTVFISEVDINGNDKYKIPSNFTKIDEFILDGIKVYEAFKKTN